MSKTLRNHVAEALLAAGNDTLDELMEDLGYRFVQWAESADNNRAPGQTCMKGCQNIANRAPWRQAGDPTSRDVEVRC